MEKPIRILQVVNIMDRAGIETMLMNYYRNMDKNNIQFDFLVHRQEKGAYDDEIESLGGKIYRAPRLMPQNYPKYFKFMKKFFKEHPEYEIVHSHIDAMSTFPLRAAKKAGVKVRIAHSHSSKLDKDLKLPIKCLSKKMLPKYANEFLACGEKAGKFLFKNKEFSIINNAIDLTKFAFDKDVRDRVRKKLNIKEETLVIGHVGRFIYLKNQLFLLDVFNELLKIKQNAKLILIGAGPDENKLREKIEFLKLREKVEVLVNRSDVNELYQAMDCFVMPSLFEGLPVVGVEAQANGLPCIFSNTISNEILMTNNATMTDLNEGIQAWINKILSIGDRNKMATDELRKFNYDIICEAKKLADLYGEMIKEGGTL